MDEPPPGPDAAETRAGARPVVRCRPIEAADLPALVRLLAAAFPDRPAAYWERGFARLAGRDLPGGVPRFGHLLDRDGEPVGVLLTLYSAPPGGAGLRCNLSSWYVLPAYRGLGTVLDGHAMRDRGVTYLNLSPAAHTIAMHEARGFRRYCRGQMVVVPALHRPGRGRSVRRIAGPGDAGVPGHLRDLARDHAAYGCLCLLCRDGERAEVVILRRLTLRLNRRWARLPRLPALQMVYGPTGAELVGWLGAIGRHLLLSGAPPLLLVDADGRLPGAVGRYFDGWRPRYARGPDPAAVGDLSHTEIAIFGP